MPMATAFTYGGLAGVTRPRGVAARCACEREAPQPVPQPVRRAIMLGGLSLLMGSTGQVIAEEAAGEDLTWNGPNSLGYSFRYPPGWKATKKQIRTHVSEVVVNKEGTSASAGVVVDPVKISSLEEFGSPDMVADKVLGLEKKKDGTLGVELLGTRSYSKNGLTFYEIEYIVDNRRGKKHFISDITVNDKNLYAFTAQAKIADFESAEPVLRQILGTFDVKKTFNNI